MGVLVERFGENQVEIVLEHQLRDRDLAKQIAGASYSGRTYKWTAPLTWATCVSARGIFGDNLEIGPALGAWASNHRATTIDPALALRESWDYPEGDEDLYPFQRAGVEFLSTIGRAMLLDEMGTGKTPQTIRTLRRLAQKGQNPFPAIVVAPNNMTRTWQKEFSRWWPEVNTQIIRGSAAQRRAQIASTTADVWIINFEGIRSHSRLAPYGSVRQKHCIICDPTLPDIPMNAQSKCQHCPKELNAKTWTSVVVDEAHRMKDPKAQQTRAIWALRTQSTKHVFALTGTWLGDSPVDLWPSLHLISMNEFPSKSKYIDRYCLASWNAWGGMQVIGLRPDTKDEFFKVTDPMTRRMPKAAVLPFLPKKTYSERYVTLGAQQRKAYDQMAKGLISAVDGGAIVASNPLVQLTRMSQFASAYAIVDDNGDTKLALPSAKIEGLLDVLDDMEGKPAVVFSQSRQLAELAMDAMTKAGITFAKIVGGQNEWERENEKERFQEGKVRVIICTIAAGGIGITLTRADTAIFLQRSWSMIENKQAEDRVHRIGSEIHDSINIVDIIAEDTLEDHQREALAGKAARLEEVLRDEQTLIRLKGKK